MTTAVDTKKKTVTTKKGRTIIRPDGTAVPDSPPAKAKAKPAKAKPAKTNSFVALAEKALRSAGKPMHVKDITAAALKAGLKTKGKTPEATMAARLGGAPDRFVKLGKGMFKLK
ncbi:MAG TPA: winged helix-turn-helix domain-containing protein [Solirubrobacteraceae bacterium]